MVMPISNKTDYNDNLYSCHGYVNKNGKYDLRRNIVLIASSYVPGVSVIVGIFKLVLGISFVLEKYEEAIELGKSLIGRAIADILCAGIVFLISDIAITILRNKQNKENAQQRANVFAQPNFGEI